MIKVLYIAKDNRENISNEFFETLNAIKFGFTLRNDLIDFYKQTKPDVVLIHHNRICFNKDTFAKIDVPKIYWVNDERIPIPKSLIDISKHIDLFLMASDDSVSEMRKHTKAEYLMMGFHPINTKPDQRTMDIVFTGQNNTIFPLSGVRNHYVEYLKKYSGFYAFGKGFGQHVTPSVYRKAKIGISLNHYDTSRTYSNRMYQIIDGGALCVCYQTKNIKEVFGNNVLYFNTEKELKEIIDYYLNNENERAAICEKAKSFIRNTHTWKHKAIEINKFINDLRT